MNKLGKSSDTSLKLKEAINFNMTVGLATCLSNFQKLWGISTDNAEKFRILELEIKSGARPTL